jgi:hypothetical protein
MYNNYDIFKKYPDGMFIWVEAARDVEAGRKRLKELATVSPGEYKLLCQKYSPSDCSGEQPACNVEVICAQSLLREI